MHGSAAVLDVDRVWVDGAVLPAARRRGLGRRLLEWAEERAASLHRERHPEVPGATRVVAHENNPGKQALVRAAGYEATRWAHTMTRGMDDPLPDVPPTPPGLTVTPYAADRDEAVRQAHREAFADDWGATSPDEQEWSRWYITPTTFQAGAELAGPGRRRGRRVPADALLGGRRGGHRRARGVRGATRGQAGLAPPRPRRTTARHGAPLAPGAGYDRSALDVDTGQRQRVRSACTSGPGSP